MAGNIIQIPRGKLTSLLNVRPLGFGELFLSTVKEDEVLKEKEIYDISGGKETRITSIEIGDIFAGTNSQNKVYAIGSSGSLKWGGITATTSAQALTTAVANPNYIYMYQGADTVYIKEVANTEPSLKKIFGKYVASNSSEADSEINPGDLFFYSPRMNQFVVLHLNHSSDALVKINTEKLISSSMRNFLKKEDGSSSTLKDFLDGPARHYQYLSKTYGWTPLVTSGKAGLPYVTKKLNDSGEEIKGSFVIEIPEDAKFNDGEILYIPFNKGTNTYELKGFNLDNWKDADVAFEGDLFIALPASANDDSFAKDGKASGVKFVRISLYGGLAEASKIDPTDILRADDYATTIWNLTSGTDGTDKEFSEAVDDEGNLKNGIKEYIQRLFRTKVDIDPKTRKIISSQLPDFLLNAPKYMGTLASTDLPESATSAIEVFNNWVKNKNGGATTNTSTNLDGNEDANEISDSPDEKLQVGCYWIWQGGNFDISNFGKNDNGTGIFNFDEDEDDVVENADGTSYKVTHALNNGDWIVYNGTYFDIIDNTTTFTGLKVGETILSGGIVELKDNDRTMSYYDWKSGSAKTTAATKEVKLDPIDKNHLSIKNENSVLFMDGETSKTDDNHIPVISAQGHAHNSRVAFGTKEQSLNIEGLDNTETTVSPTFFWNKYLDSALPTAEDWHSREFNVASYFGDKENNKVSVSIGDAFKLKEGEKNSNFTGFQFGDFQFTEYTEADTIYNFKIANEAKPKVYFPQHSGTLATEEFVDYGFAVIKQIIDDLYLTLKEEFSPKGTVDWLQTVVEVVDEKTGKKTKQINDSKVKQTYVAGESLTLDLFTTMPTKDESGSYIGGVKSSLVTKSELESRLFSSPKGQGTGKDSANPNGEGYNVDYQIGNSIYNPSTPESGKTPVNVLPNHSGMLLNDNSVIDGGYWE